MSRRAGRARSKSDGESEGHGQWWGDSWDDPYSYDSSVSYRDPEEVTARVEPLCRRLRDFDSLRVDLETRGGSQEALKRFTQLLKEPVHLANDWQSRTVKLSEPHEIQYALSDLAPGIVFDVRRLGGGFPGYFMARRCVDRWREHSVIVEDLHASPGYPMTDQRFLLSMRAGRESMSLRVSHLRDSTIRAMGKTASMKQVDERMFEVGAQVLESCWHEDQWLAFALADSFEIAELRQAVELLYLCLDRDLFDLRSKCSDEIETFFVDVYPQPFLAQLLARIPVLDGESLDRLRLEAEVSYRHLRDAFAGLLGVSVRWGPRHEQIPIWKPIYANLPRLPAIARRLVVQQQVQDQLQLLEQASVKACEAVLAAR